MMKVNKDSASQALINWTHAQALFIHAHLPTLQQNQVQPQPTDIFSGFELFLD